MAEQTRAPELPEKPPAEGPPVEADPSELQAAIAEEIGTDPGSDRDETGTGSGGDSGWKGPKPGGSAAGTGDPGPNWGRDGQDEDGNPWRPFARGNFDVPRIPSTDEEPFTPRFTAEELDLLRTAKADLSEANQKRRKGLQNRLSEARQAWKDWKPQEVERIKTLALQRTDDARELERAAEEASELTGEELLDFWDAGVDLLDIVGMCPSDVVVPIPTASGSVRQVSPTWTKAERAKLAPAFKRLYAKRPFVRRLAETAGSPEALLLLAGLPNLLNKCLVVGGFVTGRITVARGPITINEKGEVISGADGGGTPPEDN